MISVRCLGRPFRTNGTKWASRATRNCNINIKTKARSYGTRSEHDSPFDHFEIRQKPWINWKTTSFFFGIGAYLAYNETLFNWYESFVTIDETDPQNIQLLPLQLEYKLKNLPIYQQLIHPKNSEKWYKLQSWENLDRNILDASIRSNSENASAVKPENDYQKPSIVNNTLATPGGILIKPVIFHNIETDEGITIVHVGYKLCGFPFLVHGGILATLLNETFKRSASLNSGTKSNLKDDFKVENLVLEYKRPTLANQFLIVKTKRVIDGSAKDPRNIFLESVIEDKNGKVLVKSRAHLQDTGRATNAIKSKNERELWGWNLLRWRS